MILLKLYTCLIKVDTESFIYLEVILVYNKLQINIMKIILYNLLDHYLI